MGEAEGLTAVEMEKRHIRGIKCRFRPSDKRQGGKNGPIVYDLVGDAKVDWVPLYKKR